MICHPVPCNVFPLCTRFTIITVRINGNTASWSKFSPHFNVFRIHQFDKVFHNDIDAILMEISMIAEAEKVEITHIDTGDVDVTSENVEIVRVEEVREIESVAETVNVTGGDSVNAISFDAEHFSI